MKNYYRIYLGKGNIHAKLGYEQGFIGVDFGFTRDLTEDFEIADKLAQKSATEDWRHFNSRIIPEYLANHPDKTKVAAGLACGMTHTICAGSNEGDIVLVPDGEGKYYIGEISGKYYFAEGQPLPHRRPIRWYEHTLDKQDMSQALKNSLGSIGVKANITQHAEEIENLLQGKQDVRIISQNQEIEDTAQFMLEKHLEEFLVANWKQTDLGKKYDIYEVDGEIIGQQYQSDTGPIDILAISKDQKELLVVELKKGRTSDVVVGQIQRYMGYVKSELAEEHQTVKGIIIAGEADLRLERALSVTQNISFQKYEVKFRLIS